MSSFICSPEHFNSVQSKLEDLIVWDRNFYHYSFKNRLPLLYHNNATPEDKEKEIDRLMDALRRLSVLTVTLQYKHHYEGTLDLQIEAQTRDLLRNKTEKKDLSKIGLYKALQCIRYQIETEHLRELRELTKDEKDALFLLHEMIVYLAFDLVRELPEYDKSQWSL